MCIPNPPAASLRSEVKGQMTGPHPSFAPDLLQLCRPHRVSPHSLCLGSKQMKGHLPRTDGLLGQHCVRRRLFRTSVTSSPALLSLICWWVEGLHFYYRAFGWPPLTHKTTWTQRYTLLQKQINRLFCIPMVGYEKQEHSGQSLHSSNSIKLLTG